MRRVRREGRVDEDVPRAAGATSDAKGRLVE